MMRKEMLQNSVESFSSEFYPAISADGRKAQAVLIIRLVASSA